MMVIFTSRSEKKALPTTRRVLDLFAERIGNDTWRTVITAEGLETVKTLLRRTATKSTAVACHWIRSRSRSELVWIVGRRDAFDETGVVPVATTRKNLRRGEWESGWQYLPHIQALAAVAALLHDWGKASAWFQEKLKKAVHGKIDTSRDPYRHEWISVKLLGAVVKVCGAETDDGKWLAAFAEGTLPIDAVQKEMETMPAEAYGKFPKLPPVAGLLAWLMLSHHRLPALPKGGWKQYEDDEPLSAADVEKSLKAGWGYENDKVDEKAPRECFTFPQGLLWEAAPAWTKRLKKWTGRLREISPTLAEMTRQPAGALRLILLCARLSLMLGDHYVSSLKKDEKGMDKHGAVPLYANTDPKTRDFRQTLEEHLVRVSAQALSIAHELPRFEKEMERAEDVKALRKRAVGKFSWQDKAADRVRGAAKTEKRKAWFAVNMASTGCGKTIANAKIMEAMSQDGQSLRYILALGLRTLTLQTGDEYRKRAGLSESELAVLIGSVAVRELHEETERETETEAEAEKAAAASGSESAEALLMGHVKYLDTMGEDRAAFLNLFFDKKNPSAAKNEALLYKPVLVATIDHLMGATETRRGGHYLLPFLRLLSSDLVIDEIDDFNVDDLSAIARLVHLAGMLGRNVMISSATIPPDLAEGMFRAYLAGLSVYNDFFPEPAECHALLCDEFRAAETLAASTAGYREFHRAFTEKRAASLGKEAAKRKGRLAEDVDTELQFPENYFERMRAEAEALHRAHHVIDKKTGKIISFGLIRLANITPCVEAAQYFLRCGWSADCEVRILPYHSRQVLLLRHEEETYLDRVLGRKEEKPGVPVDFTEPVLRGHIDGAAADNLLFIVVATPVEEVGRDHDFDWAVIEPSSYRSIIQLSGRILRHRSCTEELRTNNVTVMPYNIRGLRGENCAFTKPGFETGNYRLSTHDLHKLVDEKQLAEKIDAVPRILKNKTLRPKDSLIDLEHKVLEDWNSEKAVGPGSLSGWFDEAWWLTALPQAAHPFRKRTYEEIRLTASFENGKIHFLNEDGVEVTSKCNIRAEEIPDEERKRLWLPRDYETALRRRMTGAEEETEEEVLKRLSQKFGEVVMPDSDRQETWLYSDDFGLHRKW